MSILAESIHTELIRRIIEIASKAFRTTFGEFAVPACSSLQSSKPARPAAAVTFKLSHQEGTSIIEFEIRSSATQHSSIRGSITTSQHEWLESLAETVQELISKEIEISQQEEVLTDYASQISRDFEELVWTREFAKRIQQTDIRNTLTEFVEHIFPTLMETVQTAQLVLVQYNQPIPKQEPIPAIDEIETRKLGMNVVNTDAIHQILLRYSERGRQQPVVSNHCTTLEINQLKSFILVPIQAKDQEFGWILALNRVTDTEPFDASATELSSDLHQAEFGSFEAGLMQSTASFLASHANNISLYADKEDLLIGIVRALANAIDAKDHYTCGHSDRVANISKTLAQELGLSEEECEEIYLAGLLHDVGKIGVPDRVLLKRGKLTDEEMDVLKQHPVIGYKVLKHLKQISYILPGVLHHHESLDGNGYPDGLVGDQIPFPARIIAVADAFDAMTSDRPYRQGMSIEKAEGILAENRGPQWDPTVLEAYFRTKEQIQTLCSQSSDSNNSEQTRPLTITPLPV